MDGNGPLIQYATLREYLPQGVQNVIWFFTPGNDTFDLENECYGVHLWNEYWRNNNIDKNGSYPKNSLYEQLKRRYF